MSQNHDPFDPDRRIRQPGPALEPRAVVVPARGAWFEATLATGLGLVPAIGAALRAKGFESGVVELEGGGFGPFAYVIPALSETGANAAFYSDVRTPSGVTTPSTSCAAPSAASAAAPTSAIRLMSASLNPASRTTSSSPYSSTSSVAARTVMLS